MITANQLQILQSPITNLIASVSTSIIVNLDDSNYLQWQFQLQLMLEGYGIMGFVDGTNVCPPQFSSSGSPTSDLTSTSSTPQTETNEYKIWKMHDRALMQFLTATLSSSAISCAIGSTSSRDFWIRLQEQFSTISRTSIFQMKVDLQNIKKGSDSVSMYLQRIKTARDFLAAAGVIFADEDIVILALNGLPAEYNTFRCVIRGRENVISLKEFRSQLLAEEATVENTAPMPFMSAMMAKTIVNDHKVMLLGILLQMVFIVILRQSTMVVILDLLVNLDNPIFSMVEIGQSIKGKGNLTTIKDRDIISLWSMILHLEFLGLHLPIIMVLLFQMLSVRFALNMVILLPLVTIEMLNLLSLVKSVTRKIILPEPVSSGINLPIKSHTWLP
ncbi:hypothetical protein ACFX19_021958 [Malus domestica]